MADKTGRALGTLDPVIYFQDSKGHILMPPVEVGKGPVLALKLFEEKFKPQGYQWKEAGTLQEVEKLQNQLIAQETRILQAQGQRMDNAREASRRVTSSNLRQRMASSSCSQYERDFIRLWLDMDEEKRKKYTQRFTERNMYLWGLEMDSSHNDVTDRMGAD